MNEKQDDIPSIYLQLKCQEEYQVNQLVSFHPDQLDYLVNLLEQVATSVEYQQDQILRDILKNLWSTKNFREDMKLKTKEASFLLRKINPIQKRFLYLSDDEINQINGVNGDEPA